jgi:DNA-binding transcriptional LysR family regulator
MKISSLIRRLDLTTLQLFLAINEEGTLTRASHREAIAVSAASKRLLELEETLGTNLFIRKATGMTLTAAGETLLHHARRVLVDIEKIGLELAEHAQGIRGHVRMMANLSAIVEFLPEDLHSFMRKHERIRIDLEERPSLGIVEAVADSLADIGICTGETEMRGLHHVTYRHDVLVVIMRPDHPLVRRNTLLFADTLDSDYVGLHTASSINARLHFAARQAGKPLRMRIHVPGFDAVCRMVQAGMGIGLIPRAVFEALGKPLGLVAIALSDAWAERELSIVVRDPSALSPVTKLLFDYLRTVENQSRTHATDLAPTDASAAREARRRTTLRSTAVKTVK